MRISWLFMLMASLCACSGKETFPSDVLKPEKMRLVMWDFVKADVYTEEFTKREHPGTDTLENMKLQLMIFSKHHITKNQFYKSYQYYYSHPELMTALLDSISASQNKIKVFQSN